MINHRYHLLAVVIAWLTAEFQRYSVVSGPRIAARLFLGGDALRWAL